MKRFWRHKFFFFSIKILYVFKKPLKNHLSNARFSNKVADTIIIFFPTYELEIVYREKIINGSRLLQKPRRTMSKNE